MKEHKVKVVVLEDGRIVIDNVPVKSGTTVEATVQQELPVEYRDPFGPATDPSEWDAEK